MVARRLWPRGIARRRPCRRASPRATRTRAILLLMGNGFRKSAVQYCLEQQDDQLCVLTTCDALVRMFNTGQL